MQLAGRTSCSSSCAGSHSLWGLLRAKQHESCARKGVGIRSPEQNDGPASPHAKPARYSTFTSSGRIRRIMSGKTSAAESQTIASSTNDADAMTIRARGMDVNALNELDEMLRTGELNVEVVDDPDSISRSIIAQLLAADSDEALQDFGNAQGWRELVDVPVELHGFRWRVSDYDEGAPIYFIVSATRLDTGDRVTLTTGSLNVLAQLSNMARRGTLVGGVWQLHEAEKQTKAGYRPLWLVQPEGVKTAAKAAAAAGVGDESAKS